MKLYDGTVLVIAIIVCVIILGSAAVEFFNENGLDEESTTIIISESD